jgi:hypothetical protein
MLALFAILLFGALALTMAFAATAETRESGSVMGMSRSLSAAEAGLWAAIPSVDWESALSYLPGQWEKMQVPVSGTLANIWVIRLDSTCFLVQSVAGIGPNLAGNPRFIRRVGVTIEVTRDSTGLIRALRVPDRAWTELF